MATAVLKSKTKGPVCRSITAADTAMQSVPAEAIDAMLLENDHRNAEINKKFNPITGEGSILERTKIEISDFPFKTQYI
ncbi:MAG: hypothetical protein IJM84_06710, partial [Bacteroidaceae bacterium]|nr:hypothetical protein [Bacteroidaceae bacterium]